LGTGNGYSVLEMIKALELASGQPIPYEIKGRRPGDIASCYAKADKALSLFGWQTQRDLQGMCESAWAWQRYCASLSSADEFLDRFNRLL
jgi:UDP-glucose 4-epimerase